MIRHQFDVSLVRNGHPGTSTSNQIGGQLIGLPVIDIHTIGRRQQLPGFDKGGLLHIGPASAERGWSSSLRAGWSTTYLY